jgi:hypothetical protein
LTTFSWYTPAAPLRRDKNSTAITPKVWSLIHPLLPLAESIMANDDALETDVDDETPPAGS